MEKITKIIQLIKKNLDRGIFIFLLILFLIQGVIFFIENSQQPPEEPPRPDKQLPGAIKPESLKLVTDTYGKDTKFEDDKELSQLGKFNIFDIKQVKGKEALEKETIAKLQQADQFYAKGNKDEALKICIEILVQWRGHLKATELRNKILKEKGLPIPEDKPMVKPEQKPEQKKETPKPPVERKPAPMIENI